MALPLCAPCRSVRLRGRGRCVVGRSGGRRAGLPPAVGLRLRTERRGLVCPLPVARRPAGRLSRRAGRRHRPPAGPARPYRWRRSRFRHRPGGRFALPVSAPGRRDADGLDAGPLAALGPPGRPREARVVRRNGPLLCLSLRSPAARRQRRRRLAALACRLVHGGPLPAAQSRFLVALPCRGRGGRFAPGDAYGVTPAQNFQ